MPLTKTRIKLDAPTLTPAELEKVDINNKPEGITVTATDWKFYQLELEVRRQYGLSLQQFMPFLDYSADTTLAEFREQIRYLKKHRIFEV